MLCCSCCCLGCGSAACATDTACCAPALHPLGEEHAWLPPLGAECSVSATSQWRQRLADARLDTTPCPLNSQPYKNSCMHKHAVVFMQVCTADDRIYRAFTSGRVSQPRCSKGTVTSHDPPAVWPRVPTRHAHLCSRRGSRLQIGVARLPSGLQARRGGGRLTRELASTGATRTSVHWQLIAVGTSEPKPFTFSCKAVASLEPGL